MQTGEIEANLVKLNEKFQLSYIPDLIARKLEGEEKSVLAIDLLIYWKKQVVQVIYRPILMQKLHSMNY